MIKFKLITITFSTAGLLLLFLCLGSQNLNQRHKINLGVTSTVALPSGFIVGISIITGIVSGGCLSALLHKEKY